MVGEMRHRGPDDQGAEVVSAGPDNVFIGNTRLAILDLSHAGHQPMHDPETGNWCVLNGEIYNHLEIRQALGDVRWRSTSDTENFCVRMPHGASHASSVCAGCSPLRFTIQRGEPSGVSVIASALSLSTMSAGPEVFAFASEVKVLLSSGLVPHELDRDGLAAYMRFGSVIEPLTLVRGVRSFSPGHWMEVRMA